jgi:hypothetical protein
MQVQTAVFEFHVSRVARDLYGIDQSLFSLTGNVIFANFHATRVFAQKLNARRDLIRFPERAVRAGELNALGLIDEILHFVVGQYRQQRNPMVMGEALQWLYGEIGREQVDQTLHHFGEVFPPTAVYRREISLDEYLAGESRLPAGEIVSNHELVLEELMILWLANSNPAFAPFLELFDDEELANTDYLNIIESLQSFFDAQPTFGPDNENLIKMMRSPAIAVPHSLPGQLEWIRENWGSFLGKYIYRLLSSMDLIKEENKVIFGFGGQATSRVYDFTGLEFEPERFSPDQDWMPSLVLMAKNAYVWLDQLSKQYGRLLSRLDEIPEEELERLSRWGFSGLWLIGLWERSQASKRIKQLRGNPDAVASAYSLFSYDIAGDLGGDEAYQALHDRAWKHGIRLASDMVPNHMGIDSRWVIEHPDWFISLDFSPFPVYSFNGPNLSWDERVGLYIEDHYYDSTDAAVVFKRVDHWSGDTRFIYHGNDGTSMPWNDTAQLNYLKSEVREAVIQTILHVARKFPIIRFDAAMTLAKKHYQRLWYPEPGSGGDIPSRAEHGLARPQFDALFPVEFWREVVDRVAQEVPDTLLLAEAFWLMEGYFVRTLGMHRVYNSAFMNMMRDEKNQEYRLVIKNTIEFDPEILKRYVNFMNNPDERTAVDQFGKGDKYFGIATLMATMPGLPMFGHGQVEGFTEKYGMEFRRAYWDEKADLYLVERHEREIFPLLRRRYLFAEVRDFLLYDFYSPDGFVNEDVFAYSNRRGDERALVLYHNKYASTRGWVRISAAYPVKSGGGERVLIQKSLAEGLGVPDDENIYTIFRDSVSGLEYIRNCKSLHELGLYAELEAYKYHVFMDFREVAEDEWRQYGQLDAYLNGRGVPSIEDAMKEIFLQPIHAPYRELVNAGYFQWLIDNRVKVEDLKIEQLRTLDEKPSGNGFSSLQSSHHLEIFEEAERKALALLREIQALVGGAGEPESIAGEIRAELESLLSLPALRQRFPQPASLDTKAAHKYLEAGPDQEKPDDRLATGEAEVWGPLLAWIFTHRLGAALGGSGADGSEAAGQSRTWMDEWLLGKLTAQALQDMGLSEAGAWRGVMVTKLLISCEDWCEAGGPAEEQAYTVLSSWLADAEVQSFLGVNRYQGVLWFNRESFKELLWWLYAAGAIKISARPAQPAESIRRDLAACFDLIHRLDTAGEGSDYQVEKLLEAASPVDRRQ